MADTTKTAEPARTELVAARRKPPQTVREYLARQEEATHALSAIATAHVPPERAMRLAINAVRKIPKLQLCEVTSFMGSLMTATGLGVEPNTALQHAFLIPYEGNRPRRDQNNKIMVDEKGKRLWEKYYECQFQIGYKGFIALMYRTKIVTSVTAEAIRAGDHFRHRKGTETFIEYEKTLDGPRGDLVGAFCFTTLRDGQAFTVLPADEIYKLRSKSQTWRSLVDAVAAARADGDQRKLAAAEKKLAETPWVMWDDRMFVKSAIRQHAQLQDLSGAPEELAAHRLAIAADMDARGEAGTIDMRRMADPELAKEVLEYGTELEDESQEEDGADEASQGQQGQGQGQGQSQQQRDDPKDGAKGRVEETTTHRTRATAPRQGAAAQATEPAAAPAASAEETRQEQQTPPGTAAAGQQTRRAASGLFQ